MTARFMVPVRFRYTYSQHGERFVGEMVLNVTPWMNWDLVQAVRETLAVVEGADPDSVIVESWARMERSL